MGKKKIDDTNFTFICLYFFRNSFRSMTYVPGAWGCPRFHDVALSSFLPQVRFWERNRAPREVTSLGKKRLKMTHIYRTNRVASCVYVRMNYKNCYVSCSRSVVADFSFMVKKKT